MLYYRMKVMLALIETFGGELGRTDCQKLMFLYCHQTGRNYYDFFPHKYGSFSLVMYQDKEHLMDGGYLELTDKFKLPPNSSYMTTLSPTELDQLKRLSQQFGKLRGYPLLHEVYLSYPYYATRSLVASRVLDSHEYSIVQEHREKSTVPCLFTIGYEGISIDAYLNKLIENHVTLLVDVRNNPFSMKYGFSKNPLQQFVENAGMRYVHIPELGIPSKLRKNLNTSEAYQDLFAYYEKNILPKQKGELRHITDLMTKYKRIALTCFESDYTCCHRSKISEYFDSAPDFHEPIVHL